MFNVKFNAHLIQQVNSKKTIILYGIALALLLSLLKYLEYRYMVRDLTLEIYMGVIALLFTALGIWMGLKIIGDKRKAHKINPAIIDSQQVKSLGISSREYDVLKHIAEGCSNQEIADKLFISLSTVKTHSSNLFVKLDVKRRTQAIQKAKKLNII